MADDVHVVIGTTERKSCAFFLKRKNRFCRMTVGEGRKYCGEHMIVAGESEVSVCYLKLKVEKEESRSSNHFGSITIFYWS